VYIETSIKLTSLLGNVKHTHVVFEFEYTVAVAFD
jgi:hypothetical protein